MIKKICSRCGKLFSGHSCPDCDKKRNQRYNQFERDQSRNAVYGGAWETTKQYVMSRDKGMCRMCLALDDVMNSTNLTVHHIVPVEDDKDLWYDYNNLVTVCAKHHQFIHARYKNGVVEKKRMQSRLRAMFEWE